VSHHSAKEWNRDSLKIVIWTSTQTRHSWGLDWRFEVPHRLGCSPSGQTIQILERLCIRSGQPEQ